MGVLLTIAAVHLVGMFVPGPNVLTVSQTAVARSRPAAVAVALGVATAALIWAVTAAAGLALLLSSVGGLDIILRSAGAAILIVLGARLVATREEAVALGAAEPRGRLGWFFARGVLVNLSNPKSLVYFTSVFTALIPAEAPAGIRVAAVAIVVAESATWHLLLALVFSRHEPRRFYARLGARIERTVGGVFVVLGARLLWAATR